jgi:hypothetical protein
MEEDTRAAAAQALSRAWDFSVDLKTITHLKSDSKLVLRCALVPSNKDLPDTIIARRLQPGAKKAAGRKGLFYNEWAGLAFLSDLKNSPLAAPRLYAQNKTLGLLVLEDLGEGPPLMDTLETAEAQVAAAGLERFMRQMGRLHAASYGHEDALARRIELFGHLDLPRDDASTDLRQIWPSFTAQLEKLRVSIPGTLATELELETNQISKTIHEDPAFRVYTHGDAGPHNITADGKRIFDFEFSGFRCGLLDAAGPRMAFPSAYRGRPSPLQTVRWIETAYREELATRLPQAQNLRLFQTPCSTPVPTGTSSSWSTVLGSSSPNPANP